MNSEFVEKGLLLTELRNEVKHLQSKIRVLESELNKIFKGMIDHKKNKEIFGSEVN